MNEATRSKLVSLLAAGVPPTAAAAATGVTPAYVSQLLDDDSFRTAIVEASAGKLEAAIAQDNTVDALKTKALKVMDQKLPFVRTALEAARIFAILDGSKKNLAATNGQNQQAGVTMVQIVLPRAAGVNLKFNSQNQVIEVGGQTMATLPSRELPMLQAVAKQEKKEQQAAIHESLASKDTDKAAEVLDRVSPMSTVIGGVVRVL